MKKRFLAFFVTIALAFSITVPAYASSVIGADLTSKQQKQIDKLSNEIYENYGVEALLVIDQNVIGNDATINLARNSFSNNSVGSNGFCLAVSSDAYYFYSTGDIDSALPKSFGDDLWEHISESDDSYYNFAKAYYKYVGDELKDIELKPAPAVVTPEVVSADSSENTEKAHSPKAKIIVCCVSLVVSFALVFLIVYKKKEGSD